MLFNLGKTGRILNINTFRNARMPVIIFFSFSPFLLKTKNKNRVPKGRTSAVNLFAKAIPDSPLKISEFVKLGASMYRYAKYSQTTVMNKRIGSGATYIDQENMPDAKYKRKANKTDTFELVNLFVSFKNRNKAAPEAVNWKTLR